jgi:hypothetical protein
MSEFATLNGTRVVSGHLLIPASGLWTADLMLSQEALILTGDAATVTLGNLTAKGNVYRAGTFSGMRSARVVGGTGGIRKVIGGRGYSQSSGVKASTVIQDLATDCGETIRMDRADWIVGASWTRAEDVASVSLSAIVGPLGWYIGLDGVIVVGERASSAIPSIFTVTGYAGANGKITVATEDPAAWLPARTFTAPTIPDAKKISSVQHTLHDNGTTRTEVWISPGDRIRDAFAHAVRASSPRIRFYGIYEYRIEASEGGAISARPTDDAIGLPEITDVSQSPGTCGSSATYLPGTTCTIMFVNGDPARPMVHGGDPTQEPIALKIKARTNIELGDIVQPIALAPATVTAVDAIAVAFGAVSTITLATKAIIAACTGPSAGQRTTYNTAVDALTAAMTTAEDAMAAAGLAIPSLVVKGE